MTSGLVRTPGLVIGDEPLDPRHPVSQLVEVAAQSLEGRIWPRLLLACTGRGHAVRDEDSPPLVGLHEPLIAKNAQRVVDRHRRDTVTAGQFPPRRQSLAWLERPIRDACPQVVGHLQVRRPRIVRIGLHLFRVSRPSSLGRTDDALGGLPHAERSSSLLYIVLEQSS